jgi:hypothetical protein
MPRRTPPPMAQVLLSSPVFDSPILAPLIFNGFLGCCVSPYAATEVHLTPISQTITTQGWIKHPQKHFPHKSAPRGPLLQ